MESQQNEQECKSVLKLNHKISDERLVDESNTVKYKLDLSDNNSNITNSFISSCVSINNYGEEHQSISDDLIQEEFEDDPDPEEIETDQLIQQSAKTDIVFLGKVPSSLLHNVKNNLSNFETTPLTSIIDGNVNNNNNNNHSVATTVINDSITNSMPVVKTLIVHQKQRPMQYSTTSSSLQMSPTSLSLSQPDENKNSILLLKAPAAYVSLTSSIKQQNQQQIQTQQQSIHHQHSEQIITQQAADYHHQQHDQRKVLTKLFLPNKIHIKPVQQKQLHLTAVTNESSSSFIDVKNGSQNVANKIKVLNLRKRFTSPTSNH